MTVQACFHVTDKVCTNMSFNFAAHKLLCTYTTQCVAMVAACSTSIVPPCLSAVLSRCPSIEKSILLALFPCSINSLKIFFFVPGCLKPFYCLLLVTVLLHYITWQSTNIILISQR